MDVLRTPHPFPDIAASHLWLCICIDSLRSCQVQGILADWQGDHGSVMLTKRLFCICLCPGVWCLWHPAPPVASLPLTGSYTTTGWPTKFTPPSHSMCWYAVGMSLVLLQWLHPAPHAHIHPHKYAHRTPHTGGEVRMDFGENPGLTADTRHKAWPNKCIDLPAVHSQPFIFPHSILTMLSIFHLILP